MLLHRVIPYAPDAAAGQSGSAMYVHRPQGASRWDNPELYDAWYFSTSAEGAVGETFGNLAAWTPEMLEHPAGLRRALATFSVPDDLPIFDFDDASNLARIAMRPSQVVIRNAPYTQGKAAALFDEGGWAGVGWWSFHRPSWSNVMLWSTDRTPPAALESVEPLDLASPALRDAARALTRPLPD
ncbi:RES family NAD+ phosphorylase [Agrococcus sp. TSP3-2-1]|uniref:RES family NAD+ phosphorylase n=1 Tax=Agrococcus sp. TSP3-2-1 TaxID=2804583 RepID=UPI003CF55974